MAEDIHLFFNSLLVVFVLVRYSRAALKSQYRVLIATAFVGVLFLVNFLLLQHEFSDWEAARRSLETALIFLALAIIHAKVCDWLEKRSSTRKKL
jgi:hypothetical protein